MNSIRSKVVCSELDSLSRLSPTPTEPTLNLLSTSQRPTAQLERMAQVAATRRGPPVSLATPARQQLLRTLILSSLSYSPQTALFFSERLYALDNSIEQSVYLIALVLAKNNRHDEAVWLLRQPVVFRNSNGKVSKRWWEQGAGRGEVLQVGAKQLPSLSDRDAPRSKSVV